MSKFLLRSAARAVSPAGLELTTRTGYRNGADLLAGLRYRWSAAV
jgi:hypothetical protein